jgi:2-polyprenyl-3-methyl-5-hydroxy-6-metoxy-1,4-benzoquinol methylase
MGIQERYAREWLGGMACAAYLTYDPSSGRFSLPPEHVPVLAQEGGPFFFGGAHQMAMEMLKVYDRLVQAFREGGGVPQEAYGEAVYEGTYRFTRGIFENSLVQEWIPAMPDVHAKLERGALVADVGCGRGLALIKLAEAFPNIRCVGYDVYGPNVERARAHAREAGVAERVRFEQQDVSGGLPQQFDLITTFDVVHDAVDPRGLLRSIRQGLREDGIYVNLDTNCADKLEENIGPLGAFFYGASLFYCMTTSLANGGEGLGTLGQPESKVRELCAEAGFSAVRRVPIEDPFDILYEIRP